MSFGLTREQSDSIMLAIREAVLNEIENRFRDRLETEVRNAVKVELERMLINMRERIK